MARPKKEITESAETTIEEIAAKEKELSEMKKKVKFNFQKQAQRLHSLYKLEPAALLKNVSFTGEAHWIEAEHVHFFHTIDSAGKAQKECVPVGGHFHEMIEVTPATETEPAVYKCSGPLKRVRQKNRMGQWEIVSVPANNVDDHTHEVTYKHTEIWTPPTINPEFVKYQQMMAAKIVRDPNIQEQ